MKIHQFFAFALLLLIAAGAQPAYSAFWQWSKTAATNATADPTINWAEGMSPSSINDSARSQMAREAEQRDDQSGSITTAGTSTAYTATTNQGMCLSPSTTPQVGQSIGITMHVTNGAAPTLQVDSCSAYPIFQSSGSIALGTMLIAQPYTLMFNGAAWVTRDFYVSTTFGVPLGGLIFSALAAAPNANFLMADGHCVSQTTYASLYFGMGSPGVGSCSAGNFNLPDLRGRAIAGLDNMGAGGGGSNTAASRMTSSASGCGTAMTTGGAACANGNESRTLTASQIPSITSSGAITTSTSGGEDFPTISGANWGGGTQFILGSGGNAAVANGTVINRSSLSGTANLTSNNTGGTAHSIIQPTIGYYVYIRVL